MVSALVSEDNPAPWLRDLLEPIGRFDPVTGEPAVPDWDEAAHEADLLERWPHLRRPGPEPHNRDVRDTLEQTLRLARRRRRRSGCPDCRRLRRRLAELVLVQLAGDADLVKALATMLKGVASGAKA